MEVDSDENTVYSEDDNCLYQPSVSGIDSEIFEVFEILYVLYLKEEGKFVLIN